MSKRMIDSELIESIGSLGNSIRSDETGNTIVGQLGKKVSIMGKAELVDGFEPIFTASIPKKHPQCTIDVYARKYDPKYNCYTFFGLLTYNNGVNSSTKFMVLGTYATDGPDGSGNEIVFLSASGHNMNFPNPQFYAAVDNELRQFTYNKYYRNDLMTTKYLTSETGQGRLYRHHLFINGDTYWDVLSTSNNPISDYYQLYEITNAQAGDSFALDSKTVATYDGSNWSINGTPISSLTDTVRPLSI